MILKIRGQHPNLRSNFQTHNNVGDKIWTCIQVHLYLNYIPTKYKENWRTHLIFRPSIPSHPIHPQTCAARSLCKSPFGPRRERAPAWSTLLRHSFGRGESNFRNFQIFIKFSKKGLWPSVFLKSLTFGMIFQKSSKSGKNSNSNSPTWHQVFKHTRILVTIF